MRLQIISKTYRVWLKRDGLKECHLIQAPTGNIAKAIVKEQIPNCNITYVILVNK
ncbi:MAG: hypothetical protein Q8920_05505 [Bacillota bacterium]|nr:hypothetical protein [Bacillota bacterium]